MRELLSANGAEPGSLGILLKRVRAGAGVVEVRALSNWRWIHFDTPEIQSLMDLERPALPVLDYTAAMLYGLVLHPKPLRVLSLGSGGGTFERFFRHYLPQIDLDSVESCEVMTQLAREFFMLPQTVQPIHLRAEDFLAANTTGYDLILCDLYGFHGHPAGVYSLEFYAMCRHSLTDGGVLAVNLLCSEQQTLLSILLSIREYFNWVSLYDVPGCRNVILYCCMASPGAIEQLTGRTQRLSGLCGLDFCRLSAKIVSLPAKHKVES